MFCIVLSQEIKTKILIGLLFDNEIILVKKGLNEACNERACIALCGCACKQLIGDFEQYQFKYKSKRSF